MSQPHRRDPTALPPLLGSTDANLSPADTVQQNLPFNGRSQVELDLTVDAVCDRYGSGSIGRATLLGRSSGLRPVSYTHLRAHETVLDIVCRLLLEKKKINNRNNRNEYSYHVFNSASSVKTIHDTH